MLTPVAYLVSFVPAWLALLTESKLCSIEPWRVSDGPVVEASSLLVACGVESLLPLAWLPLQVMDLVLLQNFSMCLEHSSL